MVSEKDKKTILQYLYSRYYFLLLIEIYLGIQVVISYASVISISGVYCLIGEIGQSAVSLSLETKKAVLLKQL